jgi:hypothetical protein
MNIRSKFAIISRHVYGDHENIYLTKTLTRVKKISRHNSSKQRKVTFAARNKHQTIQLLVLFRPLLNIKGDCLKISYKYKARIFEKLAVYYEQISP